MSKPEPFLLPLTRYIPALTGLRAMAAYLVFVHHYNPAPPRTLIHALLAQGYIGVSIFFVLSGFLLYHRYADGYVSKRNWSWRSYLIHRFARIYPLYALLLLLTVGIQASLGRSISISVLVLNLTLLKGFWDSLKFSGIAQSWSLTVEGCFYWLAPFLFEGVRRWGAWRLTIRLWAGGLLGWWLLGHWVDTGGLSFLLFYTFVGRAFDFVLGMALARYWHQHPSPFTLFSVWHGLLIVIGCVSWQTFLHHYQVPPAYLLVSEFVVYNCVLPIGIGHSLLILIGPTRWIQSLFGHPLVQALGRGSYAFYLIHLGVIAGGLQRLGITNRWLLFGLLVGIAQGLYYGIERPLSRRIRHTWL